MKNLSEKALLVNLKISQWSGHKYDLNISKKIEKQHNALNAGRFNKNLIADAALKEIQKKANAARTFLYDKTLPWGDNGDRLLPATIYFDFINEFRDFKFQFDNATLEFVKQYPALKEEARNRLNGMFLDDDYPSPSKMETKFNIEVNFMPISNTKDFRLQVDHEEVSNLKTQIELEINSRIRQATKSMWIRLKEAVTHMVDKLSDKDAIFRDSLVLNIRELIELLPRLNFTEDEDINDMLETMKSLLVDPESLRTSRHLRSTKAEEAKAILNKISDFLE
jgi:Protein of unknown function (DUF3150)